jgi:hypothetical protein
MFGHSGFLSEVLSWVISFEAGCSVPKTLTVAKRSSV